MDVFIDLKQRLIALDWGDSNVMTYAREIFLDYKADQTKPFEQFPVKKNETYSRYEICTVAEKFNLVLNVWKPNSSNPVHDHSGAKYLFKVLKGSLTDEHYEFDHHKPIGQRLEKKSAVTLGLNGVYPGVDFTGYHKIFNQSATEEAISLNLYRPPLWKCSVIDSITEEPRPQLMAFANSNYEANANTLAQ
ncbi:unnamed protein product [Lymnaea stagnalis]|uniref:Cysteine dioxygenase n=1 Tax=Lymnaea stagnalis TaxID=6523 RepID=A0AAV2HD96_LYMST